MIIKAVPFDFFNMPLEFIGLTENLTDGEYISECYNAVGKRNTAFDAYSAVVTSIFNKLGRNNAALVVAIIATNSLHKNMLVREHVDLYVDSLLQFCNNEKNIDMNNRDATYLSDKADEFSKMIHFFRKHR